MHNYLDMMKYLKGMKNIETLGLSTSDVIH